MSGAILREAAALMRERAEGVTPGPWTKDSGWSFTAPPPEGWEGPYVVAETRQRNDAEHLHAWHPGVALALADWLDRVHQNLSTYNAMNHLDAFAVARAYLDRPTT